MPLRNKYLKPVIIIPAYQPNEMLLQVVKALTERTAYPIIIINDGSSAASIPIFEQLANYTDIEILEHAINLGKGQALKTAFNHYLLHAGDASAGVVTADADGQHGVVDIEKMLRSLEAYPSTFFLGSRQTKTKVPFRSSFGNSVTRKIFQLIVGKSIYDTQTGLRAIPKSLLPELLTISSTRYEYELDMLIKIVSQKVEVRELPIETIYIDGNKSSHFNPILDSLKIYFVFVRYVGASLSSALLDFISFTLFYFFTSKLFVSLALARVLSGIFNFYLCKKMIFKSGAGFYKEAFKYLALAVFSLMLSYILVLGLVNDYHMNLYVSKVLADVCVFIINFAIQKAIVFSAASVRDER